MYSTQTLLEAQYGRENIRKWADLNNTGNAEEITARVNLALANADDLFDSMMREGPHRVPLEFAAPPIVIRIVNDIAADDLYTARGIQDIDTNGEPVHRLSGARERAMRNLREILDGRLRLSDPTLTRPVPEFVTIETARDADASSLTL